MRWLDPSQLYIASLISNGATPYFECEVNAHDEYDNLGHPFMYWATSGSTPS